jgi:hypothetical protein
MDTPEDARLAETLASLTENTSDPVLLSTQISAAKTSLDRLLTDIGSPVEGNLIPVRTNILTRTQAPRSAAEGPQDRASVTRYAEGSDDVQPMGFGAGTPKTPEQAVRFETPGSPEYEAAVAKGLDMSQAGRMARAKGWQRDMGTPTELIGVPVYRGVELRKGELREGSDKYGSMTWFSTAPNVASGYAGSERPLVIKAFVRGNMYNANNPDHVSELYQHLSKNNHPAAPELEKFLNEISELRRLRSLDQAGLIKPADRVNLYRLEGVASGSNNLAERFESDLKALGFDGIISQEGHVDVAIFDPSNIRSVNAAFDPEKSGSSTLLAAAPFAAVGGVGAGTATEGDAKTQENDLRPDGTLKGTGFLGPLPIRMPDGSSSVATEYSIGVNIDGRDLLIPTLVPTLTADQQRQMVEDIIPNNKKVPQDIVNTATQHALMRMRKGLSPFANNDDD